MIPFIRTAQDMGVLVYVTDYNENTPCKKIADKSFMVSATDVDAVVRLIKDEKIDGIITGYVDLLLPYYAEICRLTGLPCYATKEQFNTVTNKERVKRICTEHSVPVPRDYTIEDVECDCVKYPVIVKPADGSGSRGITVCGAKEEVSAAVEYALSFSKIGKYIIEDYLVDGTVLLQYYLQEGELVFLTAIDGYALQYYPNKQKIDCCGIAPSVFTEHYVRDLHSHYSEAFRSIGLTDGPMEINTFVGHGEMHLGDIGYRLCGGRANYLADAAFDLGFYKLLVRFALTGKSSDKRISQKCDPYLNGKYEGVVCFLMDVGKVARITGLEKLKTIPGVFEDGFYIEEGFEIREEDIGKLIQVVGRIMMLADSLEELERRMYEVYESVDYLDEHGRSLKINNANYAECFKIYKSKARLKV